MLSWYDEPPSMLATAVAGIARVADIIVAHDGAYALYPGARPRSHPDQAEAILRAADAAEVGCLLYRPQDIYRSNEVGKRNEGLRVAGALLEPDVDWLVIYDADFHVLRVEPELVRAQLAETEHDVASYTLLDGQDWMALPSTAVQARGIDMDTEWTIRTRDIYRWTPTLRVGPTHYSYSRLRDGERIWLRGPQLDLEPCLDLNSALAVYHRRDERPLVRRRAAEGYYNLRQEYAIEHVEVAA